MQALPPSVLVADVSGSLRYFDRDPSSLAPDDPDPRALARYGLDVKIGVASTWALAAMASNETGPGGIRTVGAAREEMEAFLYPRPVGDLYGIGSAQARTLTTFGVHSVGILAALPESTVQRILGGRTGRLIHERARGIDRRAVVPSDLPSSASAQRRFPIDTLDPATVRAALLSLNADDSLVAAMAAKTRARVLRFGLGRGAGADVWADDVQLDSEGRPSFTLHHGEEHAGVDLGLHGRHHVMNALAAAAVALGLGAGLQAVAEQLSAAKNLTTGRMEVLTRPDGLKIVNDAFNANPDSMAVAVAALAAMAGGRRTVAVLGEMKELGEEALDGHRQVGKLVADSGVRILVAVGGDHAEALAEAARRQNPDLQVICSPGRDSVPGTLAGVLGAEDIVLVKGSHSVGLEATALALTADTTDRPGRY
ncbi:cyanophycin synthetase [Streptomyces cyaneofuscatus]|uniref:glutamate ligase domain-containing protein n=1 Tax=Streptomyces cyaneofuscatus TaxID=66883 RepID=UPI00345D77E4